MSAIDIILAMGFVISTALGILTERENTKLRASLARFRKFDHTPDGKDNPGGSPKGGLSKPKVGGIDNDGSDRHD